jgi:hypothetical protein
MAMRTAAGVVAAIGMTLAAGAGAWRARMASSHPYVMQLAERVFLFQALNHNPQPRLKSPNLARSSRSD